MPFVRLSTTHLHIPFINFLGNDTIMLGGYGNVRISKPDFNYAKAAHKPNAMTLRLVDNLFTKEVVQKSTVHGTKDYAPLDQDVIAAVKGN